MARLTPLQRRFVKEYLVDMDANAAARRAGYREGSAVKSVRILRAPRVMAAVEAKLAAMARSGFTPLKRPAPRSELLPREARFVEEFMADLSPTKAAVRAGYSPRSAERHGCKVKARPRVKAEIDRRLDAAAKARGIDPAQVLERLMRIAFFDVRDLFDADGRPIPPDRLAPEVASAVRVNTRGGDVEMRSPARAWALALLLRRLPAPPAGGPI